MAAQPTVDPTKSETAQASTWTPVTPEEMQEARLQIDNLEVSHELRYVVSEGTTTFQYPSRLESSKIIPHIELNWDHQVSLRILARRIAPGWVDPTNMVLESRGTVVRKHIVNRLAGKASTGTDQEWAWCVVDDLGRLLEAACSTNALDVRWEGVRNVTLDPMPPDDWQEFRSMILIYRAARQDPALLAPAASHALLRARLQHIHYMIPKWVWGAVALLALLPFGFVAWLGRAKR